MSMQPDSTASRGRGARTHEHDFGPGGLPDMVSAFSLHSMQRLADDGWAAASRARLADQVRHHELGNLEGMLQSLVWKVQTLQGQLDEANAVLERVSRSRSWRVARLVSTRTRTLLG